MSYFLGFFFLAGSAFMTWRAVQLWRRPEDVDHFVDTFAFLPFGSEVKRGEVRSLPLTAAALWGITVLLLLGLTGAELDGPTGAVFALAVLVILVSGLTEVCVVLFNMPRFVVPPHMRYEPGVVAARRERRVTGPNRPSA